MINKLTPKPTIPTKIFVKEKSEIPQSVNIINTMSANADIVWMILFIILFLSLANIVVYIEKKVSIHENLNNLD